MKGSSFRSAYCSLPERVLLLLCTTIFSLSPLLAQETEEVIASSVEEDLYAAPVPTEVPVIPNPGPNSPDVFLSKENIDDYRSLLLAPLAAWIEGNSLVLRLARSLEFGWDYGEAWNELTEKNITTYNLDETFSLTSTSEKPSGGYPFGGADELSEVDEAGRRARMILWNVQYTQAALGEHKYEGELVWLGAQTVLRKSEAHYYSRSFLSPEPAPEKPKVSTLPAAETEKKEENAEGEANSVPPERPAEPTAVAFSGPNDLFQQSLLTLRTPPVVSGYSQLSWRFRGPKEDLYWIYSPVIGKEREVLSANRSDGLLDGTLTMDDFFVWSTKVQSVNARLLEEKVLLVPFASRFPHAIISSARSEEEKAKEAELPLEVSGLHEKLDGSRTMTLWNHETRQVARYAPWVPTSAHFVPRAVWIIELSPRDPYYSSGREILIVDKRSMLPVYKIVYDNYGEFKRIVMAAWGLAQKKESSVGLPFVAFLLAVDRGARQAMTFTPHRVLLFDEESKPSQARTDMRRLLDIRTHSKVANAKPEPPKVFVPTMKKAPAQPVMPSEKPEATSKPQVPTGIDS